MGLKIIKIRKNDDSGVIFKLIAQFSSHSELQKPAIINCMCKIILAAKIIIITYLKPIKMAQKFIEITLGVFFNNSLNFHHTMSCKGLILQVFNEK